MVDAMKKYLTIVSQFPLYGCTKVFAHYRGVWPYGIETVLAVNYDGFKLISIQEKKIIFDLLYSEIDELILKERHGECHVVVLLKNSVSQIRQKTFLFECLELDELAALIESYSPKHATWTDDPVKAWRKYEVSSRSSCLLVFQKQNCRAGPRQDVAVWRPKQIIYFGVLCSSPLGAPVT